MSLPNELLPVGLLATPAAAGGPYTIERSLRFNSADSAYLSRTPSSAGNRKTWTWSGWVKRGKLDTYQTLLGAGTGGASEASLRFNTDNTIEFYAYTSGYNARLYTTQVFRDVSAWYHVVAVFDTTNATADQRMRLYVNGSEITTFSNRTNPTQDYEGYVNNSISHTIGDAVSGASPRFFDGYLADVHFVDGSALDPTSFGEFDANNVWQPLSEVSVNYGVNGFHLLFSDNSTAAALGTDTSGKNNTWTVNNISVAAGSGNDSLKDVPVNGTETDTGLGGEVRGNYCTLNPLFLPDGHTFTQGNLTVTTSTGAHQAICGTFALSSGKWYWEYVWESGPSGNLTGIWRSDIFTLDVYVGNTSSSYSYYSGDGNKYNSGSASSYGASFTTGDVIGVAFDADAGTLTFYKNGVSQGVAYSSIPVGNGQSYYPAWSKDTAGTNTTTATMNFGQRPFVYQNAGTNRPAATYKALCTANLPTPTIADGSTAMDVALYTGNGSTQTISGLGFSPDLVWIKQRSSDRDHCLCDIVRGTSKRLRSNTTDAETTESVVTAFNSTGFTIGSDNGVNQSSGTYVAWTWDGGSSTVTNTSGSISSQVRANASAGFSIVTYTGNGTTGATIGHGLNANPGMIILKRRDIAEDWTVYHSALGETKALYLYLTSAAVTSANFWNNTAPTSSVFTVHSRPNNNASGGTYVAYCFAPVAGYSAFGSWTAATAPVFVYTGFRPAFLLAKSATGSTNYDWFIRDNKRDPYNMTTLGLFPNDSRAERNDIYDGIDFVSNGFVIRASSVGNFSNYGTMVYAAFAEHPFQYSRAR